MARSGGVQTTSSRSPESSSVVISSLTSPSSPSATAPGREVVPPEGTLGGACKH